MLSNSMREYHEECIVDWERMIETLCTGLAPLDSIDYLIESNKKHFPDQPLNNVDWKFMVRTLCTKAKASEEYIKQFITHYRDYLVDLESVPLHLANEEKFGFKSWWLRIGISDRLSLLGVHNVARRQEIEVLINSCPTGGSVRTVKRRFELMTTILRKLTFYETVAQMWVLELALWKSKLEKSGDNNQIQNKEYRTHCHYTSGVDVIVPNVMEFLIDIGRD